MRDRRIVGIPNSRAKAMAIAPSGQEVCVWWCEFEVRRPDAGRNDPLDLRAPLVADRIRLIALEFRDEVMRPAEGAIAIRDAGATSDRLRQRFPFREIQMNAHRAFQPAFVGSRNCFVEARHVGQEARSADQALVEGLKNAAGRRSIEAEIIGHDHRRGQYAPSGATASIWLAEVWQSLERIPPISAPRMGYPRSKSSTGCGLPMISLRTSP